MWLFSANWYFHRKKSCLWTPFLTKCSEFDVDGSALSSATSPSRRESALGITWRGARICWHLDLKTSRAGLWGYSCCCWMRSVQVDKAQMRQMVHPCIVCDMAFKSVWAPNQHTIWQHSGLVIVCKGCGKKFKTKNSINRHKKLFGCKPHHMKSFSMWGKGRREENDGSVQLQEEGRHPLPCQLK